MSPTRPLLTCCAGVALLLAGCSERSAVADGKRVPAIGTDAAADDVLAVVDGKPVKRAEVDAKIQKQLLALRQQEYDLRRRALDSIVGDRVLEREAKARGVSRDELIRTEVDEKVTAPTTAEVRDFYEQNKAGMGGHSFEQVEKRIETVMRAERRNDIAQSYKEELERKAGVKILLEPIRYDVPIPATAPSVGPADAPITLVEFTDYQCPFCRRAEPTVEKVLDTYKGKVRLVFRDFPLEFHHRAMAAARAVQCATEQGKFWDYHKGLFDAPSDYTDDDFKARAQALGLDPAAFASCYASTRHDASIKAARAEGDELGVSATPTFFINGQMLVGAKPFGEFKRVIDSELADAAAR